MKKFLLCLGICLCMFLSFFEVGNVFAQTSSYFVRAKFANAYSEPVFDSQFQVTTLFQNTQIDLEFEQNSNTPKKYENSGFIFVKILNFEDFEELYVLSDLILKKEETLEEFPNFNGKTNQKSLVYFSENGKMTESEIFLQEGKEIFMYEGYDGKSQFTAIAFVLENSVQYGYIKTDCIAPNGVNPIIITCIVVILAVLGIIFSWLFMKNKKKKIKK